MTNYRDVVICQGLKKRRQGENIWGSMRKHSVVIEQFFIFIIMMVIQSYIDV